MLTWVAGGLLALGVVAVLLVGTMWAVPMALVARDPRLVGAVSIGVGLVLAVIAMGRIGRRRPRPHAVVALPALAIASLAVLAWTYATAPYTLQELAFSNQSALLSGTLLLPPGAGPHPAVVFMHGSGPQHRAISFHVAERHARAGVAALIYDKRGSGASVGGHPRDPYHDLAADALAAVRALGAHPGIAPDRIGLWGLSEGGWTAPLAASMAPDEVAFLVIVSGGGASTEQESLYSLRTHLEDAGIGPTEIAEALDLRRRINTYYRTGEALDQVRADILGVEGARWFVAADWYLPRASEVYLHGSEEWRAYMAFLDFDALPLLRDLDVPMLFIHGELDRSYPAAQSAARLEELASDPDRDVTVVTYADSDHAILTRRLPWPRYADGYVDHMVAWVADRFVR